MKEEVSGFRVQGSGSGRDSSAGPAAGRVFWKTLAEREMTPVQRAALIAEFEQRAGVAGWDPVDRRDFLRLMTASLALAGLTACTKQPAERIVPYVNPPEDLIPGKPLFFATAMTLGGYGYGLLVESHMGRPTKIEGNPEHPASLGGSDVFGQASILGLYDPDRSQVILNRGRVGSWNVFQAELAETLARLQAGGGEGLRILTETVTSPTLASQIDSLLLQYPKAKWHQYEPVNRDCAHEGAKLAFGEAADVQYRLDRADVVVSLDADFLSWNPGHLRYARDFAARRNPESGRMSRVYAIESSISVTGPSADHRLAVRPDEVAGIARAIAGAVGAQAAAATGASGHATFIETLARDLKEHRGRAVVIPGEQQPPEVHALAHAINAAIEAVGNTALYTEPVEARPVNQTESLKALAADMKAGAVQVLVMLGGNPVYNAPGDLDFAAALERVPMRVHLSMHEDETSAKCQWHVPEAHYLEAWGDVRAYDGTASIVQPLIQPLYGGKSAIEIMNVLLGRGGKSGYDTVREHWQGRNLAADFESFWRKAVHDGVIPGTALGAKSLTVKPGIAASAPATPTESFVVSLLPDPSVYDGRFANNGWLQEVPRPITKLVWDNALLVGPATASERGLKNDDVVEVKHGGRSVRAPVFVVPGHPEKCGTIFLGYGRTRAGRTGSGVGFNPYAIRTTSAPWALAADLGARVGSYTLVQTQQHHDVQGRGHLRVATMEEFKADPGFANSHHYEEFPVSNTPTIYTSDVDLTKGDQWGMVINLNACIGCNACVLACQSENNISIVGKDQVRRNREMHWIRIDHYYEGDPAHPVSHNQPVTCMQCENAPCESVCPVAATVHSNDGINQMVYNRCVGTRYCSNNCPYKVRRFNFYKYADHETPSLKLMRNPDVTVRARGIMEKCTFCTQRIAEARIGAKKDGRDIRDGEATPACQQACPTRAITFGNINDPSSAVAKLRASPLNYGMLRELNTRPRTTYLARVMNPNPALASPSAPAGHGGHGEH
jgi:molybdopterin-containing oxidoreductase family iron-sulfur binding subunit